MSCYLSAFPQQFVCTECCENNAFFILFHWFWHPWSSVFVLHLPPLFSVFSFSTSILLYLHLQLYLYLNLSSVSNVHICLSVYWSTFSSVYLPKCRKCTRCGIVGCTMSPGYQCSPRKRLAVAGEFLHIQSLFPEGSLDETALLVWIEVWEETEVEKKGDYRDYSKLLVAHFIYQSRHFSALCHCLTSTTILAICFFTQLRHSVSSFYSYIV